MGRWLWLGIRLGIRAGLISGAIVGLIAAVGGSLLTNSLPDLATFALNAFSLMVIVLPLVYLLTFYSLQARIAPFQGVRASLYVVTAAAWLPAFLSSVITFMMPVVMVPLILGRGVTVENSADWYRQVYTPLLDSRVLIVAIGSLIGFAIATALLRTTNISDAPFPQ